MTKNWPSVLLLLDKTDGLLDRLAAATVSEPPPLVTSGIKVAEVTTRMVPGGVTIQRRAVQFLAFIGMLPGLTIEAF